MEKGTGKRQVTCPHCGYRMPVWYRKDAAGHGIYLKCKNKKCGRIFEIILPK